MAAEHWHRSEFSLAAAGLLIFFLLWQVGIVLGASFAPPAIADRLAVMSPTLPLHHEMRGVTNWLLQNYSRSDSIILDDLNSDSGTITRFAALDPSQTFHITPEYYSDRDLLRHDLNEFAKTRHPVLCVCSPYGVIGTMWSVGDAQDVNLEDPAIHLHVLWQGKYWRVYSIAAAAGKSAQESVRTVTRSPLT